MYGARDRLCYARWVRGPKRPRWALSLLLGLSPLAFWAPAVAGPPSQTTVAPPAQPTPATCPVSAVLGSARAPVTVDVFIDAAAQRDALVAFVEVRRLVADLGPDVNARVQFFIPRRGTSAASRQTTALLAALMAKAGPEKTLRALDRDGWSRIDTMVRHETSPQLFGIDAKTLAQAREAAPCFREALGAQDDVLTERYERWGSVNTGVFFGLSSSALSLLYTGNSEDLRLTKGRLRADVHEQMRLANRDPQPPKAKDVPVPQSGRFVGAPSEDDEDEPPAPLGGMGLEHDLVLFADSEDDHTLTTLLPLALRIRAGSPGVLSIRVVARGSQGPGRRLRSRLCAAKAIGRELDYVRYLSSSLNERAGPREEAFLSRLDTAAHQNQCPQQPQSRRGVPRGAALDGHLGVNRSDLEAIAARQGDPSASPHVGISDWLWASPGGT